MAVKVWIGENFDRRHEQEQIKQLLSLLHTDYDNQPGFIHLLCNFFCGGCQIDAAVVKRDAIIVIELKTASGPVTGAENGHWRFADPQSGRMIEMSGGSHASNPYGQVAKQRNAIAQELEREENTFLRRHEVECVADWRHFVHGLVVLAPDLSEDSRDDVDIDIYTKPWFYFCRIGDVAEAVARTTTKDGELQSKSILKMIKNVFHLEEAEVRNGVPMLKNSQEVSDPCIEPLSPKESPESISEVDLFTFGESVGDCLDAVVAEAKSENDSLVSTEHSAKLKASANLPPTSDVANVDVKRGERLFASIKNSLKVDFPEYKFGECRFCLQISDLPECIKLSSAFKWAIVVKIEDGNRIKIANGVSSFNRASVNPVVVGEYAVWCYPQITTFAAPPPSCCTTVFLPNWFSDILGNFQGIAYQPDRLGVRRNLHATEESALKYLGTYSPRTFAEVTSIADYAFSLDSRIKESLGTTVGIVDIGCGSGGATLGLLWSLKKARLPQVKTIKVVAVDGNGIAIELFSKVLNEFAANWESVKIEVTKVVSEVSSQTMAKVKSILNGQLADIVISSKFLQELNNADEILEVCRDAVRLVSANGFGILVANPGISAQADAINLEAIANGHRIVASENAFTISGIPNSPGPVGETVSFNLFLPAISERKE